MQQKSYTELKDCNVLKIESRGWGKGQQETRQKLKVKMEGLGTFAYDAEGCFSGYFLWVLLGEYLNENY